MFRGSRASVLTQCVVILTLVVIPSSLGESDRYLSSFVDFLKSLPDQPYVYEDGILLNAQKQEQNRYKIEASLKASDLNNPKAFKLLKCSGIVLEDGDLLTVQDGHECHEDIVQHKADEGEVTTLAVDGVEESTTDTSVGEQAVKLDNEVQADTAVTSGEQFVAIPRPSVARPCVGCTTLVDPKASGVHELALLAVRHLDRHEPAVKHTLGSVLEVERQVQVVNGVRYILTLNVDYNNCTPPDAEAEGCSGSKVCKISILEKPWIKLPDGNKLRAILANNCTDEWLFGDEGEVLSDNEERNDVEDPDKQSDDKIIVKKVDDAQAVPNQEKTLNEEQLKNLEEQIIPADRVAQIGHHMSEPKQSSGHVNDEHFVEITSSHVAPDSQKKAEEDFKAEKDNLDSNADVGQTHLADDKKKAIDDLDSLFEVSNSLVKRDSGSSKKIAGGVKEQNPNDPEYQTLAQESLVEYLKDSGISQAYNVVRVVSATTQVVSGLLTKVEFIASPSGGSETINCKSSIWEQPWLKKKEITVKCDPSSSQKRQTPKLVPGGTMEQNPNDPEYQTLAQDSLTKYLKDSGISQAYNVVRVVSATTQVVSGLLTKVEFIASPSGGSETINCKSSIWEQPWLKKKEITVKCDPSSRQKRQTPKLVPGGTMEQNPNDPEYQTLAQDSLTKYLKDSGISQAYNVVRVVSATTQVVSGLLTKVEFIASPSGGSETINCKSSIWEQPWLKKKEITVKCDPSSRQKRNSPKLTGGAMEQNPNDPEYQTLAQDSLTKYLKDSGISQAYNVVRVVSATTQVVNGFLTKVEFIASPSGGSETINCKSSIWEQPWLKKKEITVKCDPSSRKKRNNPKGTGGPMEQNPNDPEYQTLAQDSLTKYLKDSGISQAYNVVRVVSATTQVVNGFLTKVEFIASPSVGSETINCKSSIWEQPWLKKKEITVKCDPSSRQKRQTPKLVPGGTMEQNPNDPEYQTLAEDSLTKYLKDSGISQAYNVVRVVSATTQVVSGLLKKVEFIASPSGGSETINCKSSIWEQPWLKKKEITVKCDPSSRQKRQTPKLVSGGTMEQNPNDPEYQTLAQDSLTKYLKDSGVSQAYNVVRVVSATTQVVSGLLTKVEFIASHSGGSETINCKSSIWEQPWLKKKEITVKCDPSSRQKRNSPKLSGGAMEQNPNDPEYQTLAEDSLTKYLKDSGISQAYNVVRVVSATTQVVSGLLKKVEFIASPSGGSETINCKSSIWEQPWLKKKEITVKCDPSSRQKRQTPKLVSGGTMEQNPNDPEYQTLAQDSLTKYLKDSGVSQAYNVVRVVSATTQVVSGLLTKVEFIASPFGGSETINCKSSIWEQPWLKNKEITVKCDPSSRKKPNNPEGTGGSMEVQIPAQTSGLSVTNPNSAENQDLARESLGIYLQESGATEPYEVVQMLNATYLMVAGDLYTVDFIASPVGRSQTLTCHSEIWVRDWLKKREFKVKCEPSKRKRDVAAVDDENILKYRTLTKKDRPLRKLNRYGISLELERADMASQLANEALKHIEAKYRHPLRMKVVRIVSLDKQLVAGIHYRMKLEVGYTDCLALSIENENCKVKSDETKFCRANVWIRPWTDHPPNIRVSCESNDTSEDSLHHETQAEHLFYDFLATHKPSYVNDGDEMKRRFQIFKHNVDKIHELNTHERGTARYAVTKFSDLEYEEFKRKYLGLRPELGQKKSTAKVAAIPEEDAPDSFDWRDHGAVTEVKDQGQCGSCWAFSVTGNVEGQWKIKSGNLVSLSEQELVDCDKLDNGCNGGLPDNAYRAIEQLGGLETESDYPYDGQDDKCSFNKTIARVRVTGAVNITANETDMAKWLAKNGPISIGINANAMQFYVGGVSHPWKALCSPKNLDHGVLIVGYGEKDYPLFHKKLPYWTIKNSWGPSWGEQGYYRVYRGDGTCGVNQMASSSIV